MGGVGGLEVGDGVNVDDVSAEWWRGGVREAQNAACHSHVRHVLSQ